MANQMTNDQHDDRVLTELVTENTKAEVRIRNQSLDFNGNWTYEGHLITEALKQATNRTLIARIELGFEAARRKGEIDAPSSNSGLKGGR